VIDQIDDVPIGIHVRRGDFARPTSPAELLTKGGVSTPVEWFVDCLRVARGAAGRQVRAYVVSDGSDRELSGLTEQPNVTLVRTGSAISDLLVLAKSKVLIASGGSTFSGWAALLGQMPTISHPGQSLRWYKLENRYG